MAMLNNQMVPPSGDFGEAFVSWCCSAEPENLSEELRTALTHAPLGRCLLVRHRRDLRELLGKNGGKTQENMENPRKIGENIGKNCEKSWENPGKPRENLGKLRKTSGTCGKTL